MKNRKLLFILLISAIFRLFWITKSPPALNWDEVSIGYNAYSILKTGKDEWGNTLPTSFEAYGEHKSPGMIYASIPAIALFGLNDFAIRLTPAIIGIITIYALYCLTKELLNEKHALITSSLLAISPWHIHLSRASFEAVFALLLLILSVLYFAKSNNQRRYLYHSALFAVASIYTYNSAKIVVPILFLIYLTSYTRKNLKNKKSTIKPILLAILLLIPQITSINSNSISTRFKIVSFSQQEDFIVEIGEGRMYTPLPAPLPRIIHNKYTHYAHGLFMRYIETFSTSFLFFDGSSYTQRSTQGMGVLYLFELPLLLAGIAGLLKKNKLRALLLPWLLIAPLPSAITTDAPESLRSLSLLPPLLIIESLGAVNLYKRIAKSKHRKTASALISIFIVWNIGYFAYRLFGVYPVKYSSDWQYGYKQAITEVVKRYDDFDKIFITTKQGEPYMYTLFYSQFDPSKFQNDTLLRKSRDPLGWVHVDSFDKFYFVDYNAQISNTESLMNQYSEEKLLFVGSFGELGDLLRIWRVDSPNREGVLFELAEYNPPK